MLQRKPPKQREKICKFDGCRNAFTTDRQIQPYCGPRCEEAARRQRKKDKANLPGKRESLLTDKSHGEHVQELQLAFNAFIRVRDYGKPCPTCGSLHPRMIDGIQWDAGHYLSVGAHPELRFDEDNCHRQCRWCNCAYSDGMVHGVVTSRQYREELERRIGPERLAVLEGPHEPKHYTTEELIALKKHYRARTRELQRAREKEVNPL